MKKGDRTEVERLKKEIYRIDESIEFNLMKELSRFNRRRKR